MRDRTLIGPWIRRFLLEHLVSDRNLTRNTQASYRDTLLLLLPFVSQAQKKPTDRLMIDDLSPSRLRSFLEYLEKERGCSGATRNLRLAAIHSLAKFIGMRSPEHVAWSTEQLSRGASGWQRQQDSLLPHLEAHRRYAQTACRWTQHPEVRLSQPPR
jgi:integrase/recombinase XerD